MIKQSALFIDDNKQTAISSYYAKGIAWEAANLFGGVRKVKQ